MKKLHTCTAILCTILFSLTVAHAVAAQSTAPKANLSFKGNTANYSVRISAPGKAIKATIQLWQGNALVASRNGSGTSMLYLSKTHSVTTPCALSAL